MKKEQTQRAVQKDKVKKGNMGTACVSVLTIMMDETNDEKS